MNVRRSSGCLRSNMKQLLQILVFQLVFMLVSCGGNSQEPPMPPVPEQAPRTVLVYMSANNSLGYLTNENDKVYDAADLEEMQRAAIAGDLGNSRLIVYHHARKSAAELKEITVEGGIKTLKVYDTAESSSSVSRMEQVIDDFKHFAPAEKYGLVFWSHGSGWLQNGIERIVRRSFGEDGIKSDEGGVLKTNVTAMARVLEGEGFDYIYFDCCYMSTIEVMYELRKAAPLIVASPTLLHADGMPYDISLKHLMLRNADVVGAVQDVFQFYDARTADDRTCALAVVYTPMLDELASLTREVYAYQRKINSDAGIQRYTTDRPCYYYDFRQCVEKRSIDQSLLDRWIEVFDRTVVYKAATPEIFSTLKIDSDLYSGLSTHLIMEPADTIKQNYNELSWHTDVVSALFE